MSEVLFFYISLVRHGETNENHKHIIQGILPLICKCAGHMDTDLNSVGLGQARALKEIFQELKIDVIISSDLKRAANTALEMLGETPKLEKRLRERNFGNFCGSSRSELQRFSELNAQSKNSCDGWRSVGGECAHEMAHRTHEFLVDLCSHMIENIRSLDPYHPILGSPDQLPMPEPVQQFFDQRKQQQNSESVSYRYVGHVVLVSHGGWIRQFLRFLALRSVKSLNFPKNCIESVLSNCGICQVGVALDVQAFNDYRSGPKRQSINESPLPLFGHLLERSTTGDSGNSCPFAHLANPRIPIVTVCYHFNMTKSEIKKTSNHVRDEKQTNELPPAESLCTTMEIIFSDDGDEYAGLGQQTNS